MNLKFWLNNARTVALPQSVTPALAAICLAASRWNRAFYEGSSVYDFSLWLALIALLGVICAHLSVNLFDDYFDYKNAGIESRQKLQRAGMRARIGKANYLAEGKATLDETRRVAVWFGVVAIACGIVVLLFRGWPILLMAGIGGFLGFFYSAKPFMLCYRGLGELVTGIIFGPLLMLGMGFAACGCIPSGMGYVSAAVGLLVINILYTHSIMDAGPDTSVGKKTLATLLGTPRKMLLASRLFNFLPFVFILLAIDFKLLSPWMLLTFITLPMAISLSKLMSDFVQEKPGRPEPKFWMGPMANWKSIVEAELDWFMIRWYLSRNYLTFFILVAAIVALAAPAM